MKWKLPPKNKVFEALGCLADGRIEINDNSAKVWSSDRSKSYIVKYDKKSNSIIANDNGSYWQGYLGYPSIAFLVLRGVIKYDESVADAFKGIKWKKLNTQFKNDYNKTNEYALNLAKERGYDKAEIEGEIDKIYKQIEKLKIDILEPKIKPPKGK